MAWNNIGNAELMSSVRSKLNTLGQYAFNGEYESNGTLLSTNANIYADGEQGIADPLGTTAGWYFKNSDDLTNKVNWYHVQNINFAADMNLTSLTNQWAVVDVRAEGSPHFVVYTLPEGDGNDYTPWYRSRRVYSPTIGLDLTAYIGQTIMLYWGEEPEEDPLLPRVECTIDAFATVGVQGADEVVTTAALSTSTGYAAGNYEFVVSELGYTFSGAEQVSALTAFPTVAEEAPSLEYSDTHYIHLDAVNDYLSLTGTFNAPSPASDTTWAIGFEIESVSSVNDSTYTTMFSSGDTAFTLRKGGSNWGIYCFADGWSMAQANTWYAPAAGSKILIQWDGTYVDYYLNGTRRAHMNANNAYSDNASPVAGLLEFGKGGVSTVYWSLCNWFGGINNLMISDNNLSSDYIAEYFATQDVSTHSYYGDIVDFLPLGENTYPNVVGLKGNVTGTLENGTESDFVER